MPVLGNKHFVYTLWWIDYWEWYLVHQHKYGGLMPTIGWNMGLHGLEFYFILFYFICVLLCLFFLFFQFSSVTQSCPTLCNPMNHSMPGLPGWTPGVHPNSCPLSWWYHPTISSSVIPFSSRPQSFPASGSFQMSQLSASGGQSIGVSASTSIFPMNTQDWSPLGWVGWISLQSTWVGVLITRTTF